MSRQDHKSSIYKFILQNQLANFNDIDREFIFYGFELVVFFGNKKKELL